MKKKVLSIILSAVIVCSTLTGCGREKVDTATSSSPEQKAIIDDRNETAEKTEDEQAKTETTEEQAKTGTTGEQTKTETTEEQAKTGTTGEQAKTGTTGEAQNEVQTPVLPENESLPVSNEENQEKTPANENTVRNQETENETSEQTQAMSDMTQEANGESQKTPSEPQGVPDVPQNAGNSVDEAQPSDNDEESEECSHAYDKGVVESQASCTENGYIRYTCTECGDSYVAEIPATGHSLAITVVEATCTAEGYRKAVCSECGMTETLETYPMVAHNYVPKVVESPTCTKEGKSIETCKCGSERTITTPAAGHSWSSWTVDVEATAQTEGRRSRTCLVCGEREEESTPKHVHTYEKTVTPPTCTKEGSTLYKCTCGDSYTEVIPMAEHDGKWTVTKEPTCIAAGEKSLVCTVCGTVLETDAVDAKGHGESKWTVVKQPTCTEAGKEERTCNECGLLIESKAIPSKGHTPGSWVGTTNATCGTPGTEELHCSVCDAVLSTREVPATGHNYRAESTDATCTTGGKTTYVCVNCGDSYEEKVPAKGHTVGGYEITKQPACTEAGTKAQKCTVCGEVIKTEEIPATGHTESGWITDKEPTCTAEGSRHTECNVCHTQMNTGIIPKTEHTAGSWTVTKAATCTEKGEETLTCTECHAVIDKREIAATGHTSGDWVVTKKAGCLTEGQRTKNCTVCGNTLETEKIPATGHTPGAWVGTSDATCGAPGTEERRCETCNAVIDTRNVPAVGHSHKETVVPATCTTDGKTIHTCERCGDSYEDNIVPATGHTDNWVVVKEAGCLTEGQKTNTCSACGKVLETKTIPATGHTPGEWVVDEEAGCEKNGSRHKSCSTCGTVLETETLNAAGHNWVTNTVPSTCQTQGYTEKECTVCHKTTDKTVLELAGHTPDEWVVTIEAGCLTEGQKTRSCSVCGTVLETEAIPADGNHEWQVRKVIPPTACSEGFTTYGCDRCGLSEMRDFVPSGGKRCDYDWDSREDLGNGKYYVECKVCGFGHTFTESEYNDMVTTNAQVDAKVREVISQVIKDDMTDAEKIIEINNWLCRNVVYDDEEYQNHINGNATPDSHSYKTLGALLDGTAVCAGYARAFKDFMDELGIECLYVSSESMDHAWNQVRLEDGWYWLDTTWNDTGDEAYFYNNYLFKTGKRVDDEVGGVECNGEMYKNGKTVYDKYGIESKEDIASIYSQYSDEEVFYISYDWNSNYKLLNALKEAYKTAYGEDLACGSTIIDGRQIVCIKNSDNVREFISNQCQAADSSMSTSAN